MVRAILFEVDPNDQNLRLQLPESSAFNFTLIDHDNQECRVIHIDELRDSYVDNNLVEIGSLRPEMWSLSHEHLDKQELKVTYSDGRTAQFPLGLIGLASSHRSTTYEKKNGVSYAVDASGMPLLDATHTPRLAETRKEFHEILTTVSENRLEVTAIGAVFGKILAGNVHREMSGIISAQEMAATFTSSEN